MKNLEVFGVEEINKFEMQELNGGEVHRLNTPEATAVAVVVAYHWLGLSILLGPVGFVLGGVISTGVVAMAEGRLFRVD